MSVQIEGQIKAFCHTTGIAHNAWTTIQSADFTMMNNGRVADPGFQFAEASFLNTGASRIYISFGATPTINAGNDEAANAELMRAQAIELSPGSFLHVELVGTEISQITLRTSDSAATAELQTHAVLFNR
jgi:hypothetical protein